MRRLLGRPEMGALVFLLCMATPGISSGMGTSPRSPLITIGGQEAMLSPVLLGVCSIFMRIENAGNGDDTLLSAKADVPGATTELHDVKDGKMIKRVKIPIPAKGGVELRPGGLHIMVFRLPKDMREGHEFTLRLVFERSGEKLVSIRIDK